MGWGSGSSLMSEVVGIIEENVGDPDKRFYMYIDLINAFEARDADTLDECMGIDPEYDRAFKQVSGITDEDED